MRFLPTLLASVCAAGCFGSALAAGPARGLIVQLRDAPSHEAAMALGTGTHPDAARWERVLGSQREKPTALRPAGRAAQLLEFGHLLGEQEAEQLAASLRERPEVAWVVPNTRERRLQAVAPPNDPEFIQPQVQNGQWWLYPVGGSDGLPIESRLRGVAGFQTGWITTTGATPGPVVAVLDTGITAHGDLDPNRILPGYDFVSVAEYANDGDGRDADPSDPGDWVSAEDLSNNAFSGCAIEDSSWHGTIIAGMIAATTNNALGVAGINWNARVLPVRVAGKCGAEVVDIVDGMRWAAGLHVAGVPDNPNPARIVNISFGGTADCNAAYQSAIDELHTVGTVVVTAAGNEHTAPTRPANCNGVVGVAALNRDGFKASYSNYGPTLKIATTGGDPRNTADPGAWDDYVADGGLLTIDDTGARGPGTDTYSYLSGTSFSAPQVAGALSLMLSVNPNLTADQMINGLQVSARPHVTSASIGVCSDANPGRCLCTASTCGAGILDVPRALQYAADPAGFAPPALSPEHVDNADVRAAAGVGQDRPGTGTGTGNGGGTGGGTVPPPSSGGGGGGGALDAGSIAGLLAVLVVLWRARRPKRR